MKKFIIILCLPFIFISNSCKKTNSLTFAIIGDSHGAIETGWVVQLQKLRRHDEFLNYSISGNTIGFENLGTDALNTLNNIDIYLTHAKENGGGIDKIIVLLGTNDCKAVFDTLQAQVVENLDKLISRIDSFPFGQEKKPEIVLATPPPIPADTVLIAKYWGGEAKAGGTVASL